MGEREAQREVAAHRVADDGCLLDVQSVEHFFDEQRAMGPEVYAVIQERIGETTAETIGHDQTSTCQARHQRQPLRADAVAAVDEQHRRSATGLDDVYVEAYRR